MKTNIGKICQTMFGSIFRFLKTHLGILKYLFGILILGWLLWMNWDPKGEEPGIVDALQGPIHWWAISLAALVGLIALLLTFVRWFILVRAQELPFTVSESIRLGFVGFAMSAFLPGSIGGDVIKAACLARQSDRRTVAVATVLFDRFVGLCGLIWLVAILGTFFWLTGILDQVIHNADNKSKLLWIVWGSLGLMSGSLLFWLAIGFVPRQKVEPLAKRMEAIPKIGKSLSELWRAGWMYRSKWKSVFLCLILSLIGHVGFVLMFYFAARTIYSSDSIPTVWSHFIIIPVGLTIESPLPTPNGMGLGEAVFGGLYQWLGASYRAGIMGSFFRRMVTYSLGAIGYVVYLRMKPSLPAEANESRDSEKDTIEGKSDVAVTEA